MPEKVELTKQEGSILIKCDDRQAIIPRDCFLHICPDVHQTVLNIMSRLDDICAACIDSNDKEG